MVRFNDGEVQGYDLTSLFEDVKQEWNRLYGEVKPVNRVRWILPLLRKVWKIDELERARLLKMWFESYEMIESPEERFQAMTRFLRFLYEVMGRGGFKEEHYEVPEV